MRGARRGSIVQYIYACSRRREYIVPPVVVMLHGCKPTRSILSPQNEMNAGPKSGPKKAKKLQKQIDKYIISVRRAQVRRLERSGGGYLVICASPGSHNKCTTRFRHRSTQLSIAHAYFPLWLLPFSTYSIVSYCSPFHTLRLPCSIPAAQSSLLFSKSPPPQLEKEAAKAMSAKEQRLRQLYLPGLEATIEAIEQEAADELAELQAQLKAEQEAVYTDSVCGRGWKSGCHQMVI